MWIEYDKRLSIPWKLTAFPAILLALVVEINGPSLIQGCSLAGSNPWHGEEAGTVWLNFASTSF